MLTISHQAKGGTSYVTVSGDATEDTRIPAELDQWKFEPSIVIQTSDVKRFNSVGVKNWIVMMRKIREKAPDAAISFSECSVAVVEQVNLYGASFTGGGQIVSLYVPFRCESCTKQTIKLMHGEEVRAKKLNIENQPCSQCGKTAVFDDFPAEYFACLNTKGAK